MAEVRPLVLYTDSGRIERMRAGDTLPGAGGGTDIPWVRRAGLAKPLGLRTGAWLDSITLTASRLYFVPFSTPRSFTLTALRITVRTSSAGNARLGIYDNIVNASGDDVPGNLLVSTGDLNVGVADVRDGAVSLALQAGALYWAALIASSTPTIDAASDSSVVTALGIAYNAMTTRTHLFGSGSGSTLPATAPASLSAAEGSAPLIAAVYW